MMKGVVKWFNDSNGYGFITSDDGAEVFAHHSAILTDGYKTLTEGEEVEFETREGPKGLQAANITRLR